MTARVLLAEDNRLQAEVIRRYLEQDGHRTTVVRDGRAALQEARRIRPDLVVLDIVMPAVDGLEVCRTLRRESDVLVLMLTARSTEADLLRGLDTGADDYLTKPFSPRELVARVRTLLRRAGRAPLPAEDVVRAGALAIDRVRRTVRCGERTVSCTPVEFEILASMASRPGVVFTRAQILERASQLDRDTTERTVDVHIRNLRKKVEPDPAHPAYLVTVFGVGYKFAESPPL
ncbi:MAG TPA: response regulator transcription factor [Rugosimonospora sp.]|nr:response regulator transcription factor [Rugosimonospora sp.]